MPDTPQQGLFRKEALDRLASPDRLDQVMQVVSPLDWLPLATVAFLMAATLAWSVAGRLPIDVVGRGALVYPPHGKGVAPVEEFVSNGTGLIQTVHVQRGDWVNRSQRLVTVDLPDLRTQLALQREKLAQLEGQRQTGDALLGEKVELELLSLRSRTSSLAERISSANAAGTELRERQLVAVRVQRRGLYRRLEQLQTLRQTLELALESRRQLRADGLISESGLLEAQRAHLDATAQAADTDARIRELDARESEIRKSAVENDALVAELEGQVNELQVRKKGASLDRLLANTARANEIADVKRQIANLSALAGTQGQVVARFPGRVLECNALVGQAVTPGVRLGTIEVSSSGTEGMPRLKHTAVGYFTLGDGKRIQPGMNAQVTPDSVKREEYGGIVARVVRVSEFPVSPQSAGNLVNNLAIAQSLTDGGRVIEVFLEPVPDTVNPSGFRWSSSKGPPKPIIGTTTGTIRVTVEQRAPVTFALPLLRHWTGIQ